jgi:competence protein ComEA
MSLRLATILLTFISLTAACGHRSPATVQTTLSNSISAEYAININTATLDELQRIPHVGEKVAAKIIGYREINGPFRRVEHLMLIQGISDKRFRKIRPLVRVE